MVHRKLLGSRLGQLNDNLGEKQNVRSEFWVLVDKIYYCDSVRHNISYMTYGMGN
jgi:hypothetical protein